MNLPSTAILDRFTGRRVLLVGDFMLDRYIYGDVERISPEAPVPVARVLERQERVGGAGSVALNVLALGASVECLGVVGRDLFAERVLAMLRKAGAGAEGILRAEDRPTITKTRVVGLAEHRHRQQLLRIDDEVASPLSEPICKEIVARATEAMSRIDVMCLEDYAKGLLTPALCAELIAAAKQRGIPVLIDPARSEGWDKYTGATCMTPNRNELESGFGRRIPNDQVESAAAAVVDRLQLESVVITLGRDGALLVRRDGSAEHVPTVPRAVYDNTGAGDAVLAMMAVALASGATDLEAVQLANIAGGLEVEKFGCVPISRDEVLAELQRCGRRGRGKVRTLDELLPELDARRQRGETVAFTNGCFDLLHPGHVELLEGAKQHGSILVVGLNSDASMKLQGKGDDRPIRDQKARARMLSAIECVDYVVLFDEKHVAPLVERIVPDVLIKGSDVITDGRGVVGADFVLSRGGRIATVSFVEGYSTTREIEKIRNGRPR